ncbi:MAG: PAS domain-containing protein [Rhizomicrobium sp.]
MSFDFDIARRCFDECPASKDGNRLARYWLSLWHDGRLPTRAEFKPKHIADLLPAICIFDVVPDVSVRCRLAGSRIVEGAGEDITGKDWLALTTPENRGQRLARFSEVARGGIGRGTRAARRASGDRQHAEEIMLPFGDIAADGARQVLIYVGWRPSLYNPAIKNVANTGGLLLEYQLTQLWVNTASAA